MPRRLQADEQIMRCHAGQMTLRLWGLSLLASGTSFRVYYSALAP